MNCEAFNSTDVSLCTKCEEGYALDPSDKSCIECGWAIDGCTECSQTSLKCYFCNTDFPTYDSTLMWDGALIANHDGSECIANFAYSCWIPKSSDYTKCSVCQIGYYLDNEECKSC